MPLKTHIDEEPSAEPDGDAGRHVPADHLLHARHEVPRRGAADRAAGAGGRRSGTLAAAAERKTINVYRDGTITIDQKPVTLDELTARLAAARRRATEPRRARSRRRPGRVPAGRRRAERLQTGGHRRPGHLRPPPPAEEVSHGRVSSAGRVWSLLTGMDLVMGLLWLGLAAFTVALVVLIWTRWGQYRPLRKCLVLSLLAHLLWPAMRRRCEIVGLVPSRPRRDVANFAASTVPADRAATTSHAAGGRKRPPLPLLDDSRPGPQPPPAEKSAKRGSRINRFPRPPRRPAARAAEISRVPAQARRATQPVERDRGCGGDGREVGGSRPAAVAEPQSDLARSQVRPRPRCRPSIDFAWPRTTPNWRKAAAAVRKPKAPCRPPCAGWPRTRVPTDTGTPGNMRRAGPPWSTARTAACRHRGRQRP